MKKLIYIAGKLTDYPEKYITNMREMVMFARAIEIRYGVYTHIPCLDILKGLVCGDLGLHDYMGTNVEIMLRCDAVFLCPGWSTSKGTKMEIELAEANGIPVCNTENEMWDFCAQGHLSECQKMQAEVKAKIERMRNAD